MRASLPMLLIALACGLLVGLGAWAALRLRELRERRRARARNARGERGEREAERVLQAQGYRIRARQVPLRYAIAVDGSARDVELVADLVVERDGEQLIAEVKTGGLAPRIGYAETRRQLLEYQVATGAARILLVDPEAGAITEVAFPVGMPVARARSPFALHASAIVLAGLAAAAWWFRRMH